jgi:hypothetical protein
MRRKIVFHHLAKTGGTSLILAFKALYGHHVCDARYDVELEDSIIDDPRLVFFHGHYSFDRIHHFKQKNTHSFVFTLLREPMARVMSQYFNWIDRNKTMAEFDEIEERGLFPKEEIEERRERFKSVIPALSFEEFLANAEIDPSIRDVVFNHQARYLSFKNSTRDNGRTDTFGKDLSLSLEQAMHNLSAFYDFVGILDDYQESCERLSRLLQIPALAEAANIRLNENRAPIEGAKQDRDKTQIALDALSPACRNRLAELNEYDTKLYEFARERFYSGSSAAAI